MGLFSFRVENICLYETERYYIIKRRGIIMRDLLVAIIGGFILALVFSVIFFTCFAINEVLALVIGITFVVILVAIAFTCLGYEIASNKQ